MFCFELFRSVFSSERYRKIFSEMYFSEPDDLPELCRQPVDIGPCRAAIPSWYYSPEQGRCIGFSYGGCRGNANRFRSVELCERDCGEYRNQGEDESYLQHFVISITENK